MNGQWLNGGKRKKEKEERCLTEGNFRGSIFSRITFYKCIVLQVTIANNFLTFFGLEEIGKTFVHKENFKKKHQHQHLLISNLL